MMAIHLFMLAPKTCSDVSTLLLQDNTMREATNHQLKTKSFTEAKGV